jgi:hypothetical protein
MIHGFSRWVDLFATHTFAWNATKPTRLTLVQLGEWQAKYFVVRIGASSALQGSGSCAADLLVRRGEQMDVLFAPGALVTLTVTNEDMSAHHFISGALWTSSGDLVPVAEVEK